MLSIQRILTTQAPASVLLIRLFVGAVFLSEGIQKFLFPGEVGAGRFAKIGIPSPDVMAPFVGVVEIVCGTFIGAKPVIISVVVQALWSLGRNAIKTRLLAAIGIAGVIFTFLGIHELLILLGGGFVVGIRHFDQQRIKAGHKLHSLVPAARSFFYRPPPRPQPHSAFGGCFFSSSRSVRCSTAAATCCWPSSEPIWSNDGTG